MEREEYNFLINGSLSTVMNKKQAAPADRKSGSAEDKKVSP